MLHNEKFSSMSALEAFCAGGLQLGVPATERVSVKGLTLSLTTPAVAFVFSFDAEKAGLAELNAALIAAGSPADTLRFVSIDRQMWLVPVDYNTAVGIEIAAAGNEEVLNAFGLSSAHDIKTLVLDDELGVAPKRVRIEETARGFVTLQWESA